MYVYTLGFGDGVVAGFVGKAVVGAGGGSVGLPIQDNCAVHAIALPGFLVFGVRGTGHTP
jgi:hypothetical protein